MSLTPSRAATAIIGWAVAHHTVRTIVATPDPAATPPVVGITLPAVTPHPVEPPPPLNPPSAPKLQGIFYSPTGSSAIVDGKTVRTGDQFHEFRVKSISKFTVTLVGPDKKEIKIGMGN